MNEEKKHKFTARIGDVEPFVFDLTLSEEEIFRKATFHVNELWNRFRAKQPNKSSQYVLAKVALAFAELYYRKSEQLSAQKRMLDEFEKTLDEVLLEQN
ncbi:MAG: cell division protein ZapA [Muribaculaceae bacterium]|nr:cell division protein ZapA [Muribaculaceae bacterium]